MIDKNKIAKAARQISEYVVDAKGFDDSKPTHLAFLDGHIDGFNAGAKWAINEFLNDLNELLRPASEVPRNDNGKILAFSKERGYRKLYDMNAMLDKTTCNTYQEMWEVEVNAYCLTNWIFVEELFDMIMKGGELPEKIEVKKFTSRWWKWLKRASYSLFHYNKNVEQQKLIKRCINEMSSVLLDNLYGYWRGDLSDYLKDRGNLKYFMRGYENDAYNSVMEWLDKKK